MNEPNGQPNDSDRDRFLYPRSRYHGQFSPPHLAFNANLQEFAQRVALLCGLETGGKITPEEAYQQIKSLYKQLKRSKKALKIGDKPPSEEI